MDGRFQLFTNLLHQNLLPLLLLYDLLRCKHVHLGVAPDRAAVRADLADELKPVNPRLEEVRLQQQLAHLHLKQRLGLGDPLCIMIAKSKQQALVHVVHQLLYELALRVPQLVGTS